MGRYGGREYAHSTDPYDAARKKEQEDRVKDIEALQGRPPFKSMSKAVDFFDGHGRVASSKAYTEDPRVPERPAKPPEFTNVSDRPFFPAQAPKSGPQGTFNKFPEYKEDPLHLKVEAAKKAAEEARAVGDRPFKPTGYVTTNTSTIQDLLLVNRELVSRVGPLARLRGLAAADCHRSTPRPLYG